MRVLPGFSEAFNVIRPLYYMASIDAGSLVMISGFQLRRLSVQGFPHTVFWGRNTQVR